MSELDKLFSRGATEMRPDLDDPEPEDPEPEPEQPDAEQDDAAALLEAAGPSKGSAKAAKPSEPSKPSKPKAAQKPQQTEQAKRPERAKAFEAASATIGGTAGPRLLRFTELWAPVLDVLSQEDLELALTHISQGRGSAYSMGAFPPDDRRAAHGVDPADLAAGPYRLAHAAAIGALAARLSQDHALIMLAEVRR